MAEEKRETPVNLEVRMTPENLKKHEKLMMDLARAVVRGEITEEQAKKAMAEFNLEHTEFRLNGGPWRPLREA